MKSDTRIACGRRNRLSTHRQCRSRCYSPQSVAQRRIITGQHPLMTCLFRPPAFLAASPTLLTTLAGSMVASAVLPAAQGPHMPASCSSQAWREEQGGAEELKVSQGAPET